LGGAPFTLEEATRYSARRVRLLDIVDGQREEITSCLGSSLTNSSDQDDGVAHGDTYGSVGLTGHLTRLDCDGVSTIGKRLADNAQRFNPRLGKLSGDRRNTRAACITQRPCGVCFSDEAPVAQRAPGTSAVGSISDNRGACGVG